VRAGKVVRRLLLAALLPCLLGPAATVAAQEGDIFLPRCGIRYPGGYERHTARAVEGVVEGLTLPESGPVSFRLRSTDEVYVVLGPPSWYWRDQGIPLADGSEAGVTGSATVGRDGELYLLARELRPAGAGWAYRLRDMMGRPAWRGCRPGACASARVPLGGGAEASP